MTDQMAYVRAFETNDNHVIQKFYKENYPMVKSMITKQFPILKDEDVKDIFQEGVIALWSNIKDGVFTLSEQVKLSTYLGQICKYKCLDRMKKKSFQMEHSWEDTLDYGEDDVKDFEEDEEVTLLRKSISNLGERCRNLLTYFYFEEKKLQEIALLTGIGESSIKNEKYRCMQKLKELYLKK